MKLTFLGTGTSFGIPQIGCSCRVCRSADSRDRRTRVGAVVDTDAGTRILIDTPPELRLQLIAAGIDSVDAILFTHEHADHTNGIDDVRAFSVRRRSPVEFYGSGEALARIADRFDYIFDNRIQPLPGTSKPEGRMHPLEPGRTVTIAGVDVTAVPVPHGPGIVYAYRLGGLGYVTDAGSLPGAAIEAFRGVSVLVLNALFHGTHPMHLSIPEAVRVAAEIGAARTYLTHLTHENLHAELEAELPPGVEPAYDGLVVTVS
jgi:phosphoribosyl 1,2-cyclic phosphate phosphodiesterase